MLRTLENSLGWMIAIARSDREVEAPESEFLVEHGSFIEAVIPL